MQGDQDAVPRSEQSCSKIQGSEMNAVLRLAILFPEVLVEEYPVCLYCSPRDKSRNIPIGYAVPRGISRRVSHFALVFPEG